MPPSVLLIDDDEDSITVYRSVLTHYGCTVFVARSPDEGIALAMTSSPDVIVTELFRRTEGGGWYTPEALRGDARTRSIPIISVSASCMPDDRHRAEKSGCAAFLPKPVSPSRLFRAVSALVNVPADSMTMTAS